MTRTQLSAAEQFGRRLAQERRHKAVAEERDIGQKEVAKAVSVSESTLSRWEAGETMPRDDTLARLAKYFGVTLAWLRYGTEPREAPAANHFPSARLTQHPSTKQSGKPRRQA